MRNKFTSSLFKRGLISFAAASVLTSGVYASTAMGTGTTQEIFNDFNTTVTIGDDFNVTESIGSISTATNVLVYITIPSGVEIMAENNATRAGATRWGDINISGSDLTVGDSIYIEGNGTSSWLSIDYNSSSTALLIPDFNTSNISNGIVMQLDASGSADTSSSDINGSIVGEVTAIDGNEFTFSLLVQDAGSPLSISLINMMVAPASDSTTGAQNFTISSDGGEVSTHSLAHVNLLSDSEVAWFDLNATTVPNINSATGNSFADFNITLADNLVSADGNISITLSAGTFENGIVLTNENGLDVNVSTGSIGEDSNLIVIDSNASRGSNQINIYGTIDTSDVSSGTDITVTFTGSSPALAHTDEFDGLSSSTQSIVIAHVVSDGMEVELADSTVTAATTAVVVGRTFQRAADVNITELFNGTFTDEGTLTLELPTGYLWSSAPYLDMNNSGDDNQTLINADGSNVYTVTFNEDCTRASGTVKVETCASSIETLSIENIDITVPDTAVEGDIVTLSFGGSIIDSNVDMTPSTVDIATVRASAASVEDLNDITSTDLIISMTASIAVNELSFAVQETYAGILAAGSTISATLSSGSFEGDSATAPADASQSGEISLDTPVYSEGDANNTVTWTITDVSTIDDSNVTFYLPSINFDESSEQIVTATIAGTAGVIGTINIADLREGVTYGSGTFAELDAGNIDVFTGEVTFTEQINNAFSANTSFRVVSNDPNVIFTGDYQYSTKQTTETSWSDYESAVTTDNNVTTTFNQNDTLHVGIPSESDLTSDSSMGMLRYRFAVNIRPEAVDGEKTFQIRDYSTNGIGIQDTTFSLIYVGTVPALGVAETVEVDAEATTTTTITDVVGELTATSDNANVTVSVSGAIITIDASDAATGDTATITVSDDRDEEYTMAVTVNGTTVEPVVGETTADITDLGQTADETKLNVVLKNDGVTQNADGSLNVADKMTVTVTDTGITVEATQEGYTVSNVEVKEGTAPTSRAVVTETEYIQISDDKYLEVTLEKTVADVVGTPALVAGWNLLGNASGSNIDSSTLGGEIVWTFDANPEVLWTQDATIANGAGFWYKATAAGEGLEFTMGNETAKVADNFVAGTWSLLGCGGEKTIADVKAKSELTDSTIVWAYDGSAEQPWSNDDATTVKAGQGYWVK